MQYNNPEKIIQRIKLASKASTDGSVKACIEVNWRMVITASFEASEIEDLDEESLRDALDLLVDEIVMSENAGESIDLVDILETRDGETDQMIAPDKLFIVSGRVPGDDDDTVYDIWASNEAAAIEVFKVRLRLESNIGVDDEIFIITTLCVGTLGANGMLTLSKDVDHPK